MVELSEIFQLKIRLEVIKRMKTNSINTNKKIDNKKNKPFSQLAQMAGFSPTEIHTFLILMGFIDKDGKATQRCFNVGFPDIEYFFSDSASSDYLEIMFRISDQK